ncbi:MAG: ATP-binding protein [Solirubrobacteraceae bacterium]
MRISQFELDPRSVSAARRFTEEALRGRPRELIEPAVLMVSELATNSIRHAMRGFQLTIACERDAVRIEVTDRGGGNPRMQSPGPDEPTGRGLRIVNELADAWGVQLSAKDGKTVWFKVASRLPDVTGHSSGARGYVYRATSFRDTLWWGPRLVIQTR